MVELRVQLYVIELRVQLYVAELRVQLNVVELVVQLYVVGHQQKQNFNILIGQLPDLPHSHTGIFLKFI